MKFFFLLISMVFFINAFGGDTTFYSCKYRYTKQKDSSDFLSKDNDIMILSIGKKFSLYYSYLKHFGNRNMEEDNKTGKNKESISLKDHTISIDASKRRTDYYMQNETEVIKIDYNKKVVNITDQLFSNAYEYSEDLVAPKWQIELATTSILNQKCQRAVTLFKGRKYTAWFASSIPLPYGPWMFNGLPGLILRVSDDKEQFVFECIELNTPWSSTKVFKPYTNIQLTTKKKLSDKKKLLQQNPIAFMQEVEGKTITMTDANGNPLPVVRPNKPYNPIDLSNK